MQSDEPPPPSDYDRLCKNTFEMFDQFLVALDGLKILAVGSPDLARNLHINIEGGIVTVPVILREMKRDIEWLEKFYQRR